MIYKGSPKQAKVCGKTLSQKQTTTAKVSETRETDFKTQPTLNPHYAKPVWSLEAERRHNLAIEVEGSVQTFFLFYLIFPHTNFTNQKLSTVGPYLNHTSKNFKAPIGGKKC